MLRCLAFLQCAIIAVGLSACTAGAPHQLKGNDAAGANAEYLVEESKLPPLPPGSQWAHFTFPSQSPNGARNMFGIGFGTQIADSHWECLWMAKLLADQPNTSAYTSDLASLAQYKQTYFYLKQAVARQVFDPEFVAAQAGDTRGLATDYAGDCN